MAVTGKAQGILTRTGACDFIKLDLTLVSVIQAPFETRELLEIGGARTRG